MKKENKSLTKNLAIGLLSLSLIGSCKMINKEDRKIKKDCSSIFENKTVSKKTANKANTKTDNQEIADDQTQTSECKILEFKINDKTKCEIVGSDKIDNFSKIIDKNYNNKIIIAGPEDKLVEYVKLLNKYLVYKQDIDIQKYVDSDIFKNFPFPYKGFKCKVSNQEYIIWSGKGRMIATIGKVS